MIISDDFSEPVQSSFSSYDRLNDNLHAPDYSDQPSWGHDVILPEGGNSVAWWDYGSGSPSPSTTPRGYWSDNGFGEYYDGIQSDPRFDNNIFLPMFSTSLIRSSSMSQLQTISEMPSTDWRAAHLSLIEEDLNTQSFFRNSGNPSINYSAHKGSTIEASNIYDGTGSCVVQLTFLNGGLRANSATQADKYTEGLLRVVYSSSMRWVEDSLRGSLSQSITYLRSSGAQPPPSWVSGIAGGPVSLGSFRYYQSFSIKYLDDVETESYEQNISYDNSSSSFVGRSIADGDSQELGSSIQALSSYDVPFTPGANVVFDNFVTPNRPSSQRITPFNPISFLYIPGFLGDRSGVYHVIDEINIDIPFKSIGWYIGVPVGIGAGAYANANYGGLAVVEAI